MTLGRSVVPSVDPSAGPSVGPSVAPSFGPSVIDRYIEGKALMRDGVASKGTSEKATEMAETAFKGHRWGLLEAMLDKKR